MLKLNLISVLIFYIFFISSCDTKQNTQNLNTDCEIISMVYDTFMHTYKNEFKYMKLDTFYICQFDSISLDPSLRMQNIPDFRNSEYVHFEKNDLLSIGESCFQIPDMKFIDSESALDTMMFTKTTNKVIWGITNYRKNSKYAYLIFGAYFSRKAVIASQYLLEYKNIKFEIIEITM